jgi:acyl phosphate:glycerol-3-phosphate acyltransferase
LVSICIRCYLLEALGIGVFMIAALLWSAIGFLAGAIPFSVLLGRYVLHTDIRARGDGNPGSINVLRAGGKAIGLTALILDYLKGAIPVGLAVWGAGLSGWQLLPVAVAPVLGHAFSPFLRWRGGKAIATTFGVWTGLTLWQAPTILGLTVAVALYLQDNDGWSVMTGMAIVLVYLVARGFEAPLVVAWIANIAVVAFKHRQDLRRLPKLRERRQANRHDR